MEVKKVKEIFRSRAKELGLEGKGKCYNDKRKNDRVLKVGLHKYWRDYNEKQVKEIEKKIQTIIDEFKKEHKLAGEVTLVRHGSCLCCGGASWGIKLILPL